ncbi:hypothetical protein OG689_36915 [Kitasatospora sp. NBC_00240]|uniref:hypothetical protein n=1 Tax=Kitasatospora sp. NBC_00240 TaxID=2903567 RepID=UPI00225BEE2F|nr:hypothetical protein [Kitasatospora sp. NBC_00240]MCX5214778.1 hypothetical protein [Kitasatospora sp. NBC_00240]
MPWKSRLTWTGHTAGYATTVHEGRTWHLSKHLSPPDDQGRYSPYERWYLHADDGQGQPLPDPASGTLGRNRVKALQLAELIITGWENTSQVRPSDGVQLWRRTAATDGAVVPLDELLAGKHR